jgi:16S rRNA (cytidine1402-2'-O)-methyltransferase
VGKIILLNTPIGNLGDVTSRVKEALQEGEFFAVEDTRMFKDLLNLLGVSLSGKRIISFHDHSKPEEIDWLLDQAKEKDLYLASDAGSPMISDPAYPLIKRAYERDIEVDSYSGVSAPIMALELSGLPPIPFHFHGFFPREKGSKEKIFEALDTGTHIFFEAPTRVEETLDIASHFNFEIAVVRELSKKFQQTYRFHSKDWKSHQHELTYKGEFVLLFYQKDSKKALDKELTNLAQEIYEKGATPKQLSKLLSQLLDIPTKDIYSSLTKSKN